MPDALGRARTCLSQLVMSRSAVRVRPSALWFHRGRSRDASATPPSASMVFVSSTIFPPHPLAAGTSLPFHSFTLVVHLPSRSLPLLMPRRRDGSSLQPGTPLLTELVFLPRRPLEDPLPAFPYVAIFCLSQLLISGSGPFGWTGGRCEKCRPRKGQKPVSHPRSAGALRAA